MSQILGAKFIDEVKAKLKHNSEKVVIENQGFRFFSKVTFSILMVCCGLVTLQGLIGKQIECVVPQKEDIRVGPLDQYCFIMSTYTLPHLYNDTLGQKSAHFGVGTYEKDNDQETKYHAYYQWVPFVLFFQGLLFYVPHFIWKAFEGNKLKTFCNLDLGDKILLKHRKFIEEFGDNADKKKEEKEKVLSRAAETFVAYLDYNHFYAYMYIFCEILNFVIVILNIYLTDAFLGYEFTNYGPQVISFLSEDPENRIDPMSKIFPKVTKCDFHKYGPSGNLINYDVMCVLALNVINEKIYTFLWFWFVILGVIGGLCLVYRIAVLVATPLRNFFFERKLPNPSKEVFRKFDKKLNYPSWFVLKRIGDNLNGIRLGELCKSIANLLEKVTPPQTPPPVYNTGKSYEEEDEVKQPLTYGNST